MSECDGTGCRQPCCWVEDGPAMSERRYVVLVVNEISGETYFDDRLFVSLDEAREIECDTEQGPARRPHAYALVPLAELEADKKERAEMVDLIDDLECESKCNSVINDFANCDCRVGKLKELISRDEGRA